MNKSRDESVVLAKELTQSLSSEKKKIMIAPPFTSLPAVAEVIKGSNIRLGAQNMGSVESGAHTGEVSVLMLKELGVSIVMLGHSERRHIYGENDNLVNTKLKLALKHGMEVILCVGETLEEREKEITKSVVEEQVSKGFEWIPKDKMKHITIAYEPVWAIGTGKNATPEDAEDIHQYIRSLLNSLFDSKTADNVVIQYGGSVKPDNIKELMKMDNVDGVLVGGASLKAETFIPIVQFDKINI